MYRQLVVGVVVWSVALFSSAARAEDVKAMYARAQALYALQHFDEAAPLFEKAFEQLPDPALLYNAAQAHRFAGNQERALKLYESYVRLYGDKIPNRDEAEGLIASLRQSIETQKRVASEPPKDTKRPATTVEPAPEPSHAPVLVVVSAPPPARVPLVKRPWFWGVIAGGAVVVAGVAIGVSLGAPGAKNPPASFGTVHGN